MRRKRPTLQNQTFQASVTTDRTQYTNGQAVEIWVKLTNISRVAAAYRVVDGFEYEIKVRDVRTRKVVWTWSKGKPTPPNLLVTLQPGESRQHRELWDRRDDSSRLVPTGLYEVEAIHTPQTQPARIQIFLATQEKPAEPTPSPAPASGLSGTLRVNRALVRPGETVTLFYTVTNQGKAPVALSFSSGKQIEIEAVHPLWQLSRDQLYTQAFTRFSLEPRGSKTFTVRWTLPKDAPEGRCDLSAYLTPVGEGKLAYAATTLTLKP